MKKFFNKKHALPVVLGILTLVISLAGAYAWFTASAVTTNGSFKSAVVKLTSDTNVVKAWNFKLDPASPQIELEKLVNDNIATPAVCSEEFAKWWGRQDSSKMFSETLELYDTGLITPGSILQQNYKFKNDSTVPVYLRIKNPEVKVSKTSTPTLSNKPIVFAASIICDNADDSTYIVDSQFEYGTDGWLYFTTPIMPSNGGEINIWITAYLSGELNVGENGATLQNCEISLGNGDNKAELIQATNNAVYMTDWANGGVTFK